MIVETGRRDHTQVAGKLPGPQRIAAFTKSSFAHSTLVVDGVRAKVQKGETAIRLKSRTAAAPP